MFLCGTQRTRQQRHGIATARDGKSTTKPRSGIVVCAVRMYVVGSSDGWLVVWAWMCSVLLFHAVASPFHSSVPTNAVVATTSRRFLEPPNHV